jgi:haloacetate dehalogenase
MDRADVEAGHPIQCPVLVIWGTQSHTEKMSDPRVAWLPYTKSLPQFCPLPCGHYPAEQVPEETYTALDTFFKA